MRASGQGALGLGAETDSLGRYELELTTGSWILSVRPNDARPLYYARDGVRSDPAEADTLVAPAAPASDPIRADFVCAALELHLQLPPDLDGEDVTCSMQSLSDPRWSASATVEGARSATFAFPLLAPGEYRAQITACCWQGPFLPGTYASAAATVFTVEAGRSAASESALPVPARITGSIRGSWERMDLSNGPHVLAFTADSTEIGGAYAEDGTFALRLYGPVRVRLGVGFGYGIEGVERWIGGDTFAEAPFLTLAPGDEAGGIELVECGILCRFQGPAEAVPRGQVVRVVDETGRTVGEWEPNLDGPDVAIPGLKPGSYRLQVRRRDAFGQDWLGQWYDGADSAAATPIALAAPGDLAEVTFRLERGGLVRGRVRTRDGSPLPYSDVYLSFADPPPGLRITRSSRNGDFEIGGIEDGNYYIGVRAPDGAVIWHPGVTAKDSATVIRIVNHSEITGLDWRVR